MTPNDKIIALIRTGVPALVGLALAKLIALVPFVADVIAWADTNLGDILGVPVAQLLAIGATALVITGYYWLARKLGARWPWIEGLLLGSSKSPSYAAKHKA